MKKKLFILLFLGFWFICGANINAKEENVDIKLFVGEETTINLDKRNISYDKSKVNLTKVGCEGSNCFYKVKGLKTGETILRNERVVKYNINIIDVKGVKNKKNLSADEMYDLKVFNLLQKHGISSMIDIENVKTKEREDIFNQIELFKQQLFPEYNYNEKAPGQGGPGDVFLTTASKTGAIKHGHAGIGAGGGRVVEANPKYGVQSIPNNVNNYWDKVTSTSKRYTIVGSTASQKKEALKVANKKVGKPYGLNEFGDKVYFCTKLAWTAWNYSGSKNKLNHDLYASQMMKSKSLKLLETYHK